MDKKKYLLLTPTLEKMLFGFSYAEVGLIFIGLMQYAFDGIPPTEWPSSAHWDAFKEYVDTQDKYLKYEGERHWNWKGGITPENAADFIKCGACAVSGARTFMDFEKIEKEGLISVTNQVRKFVDIIAEAKKDLPVIP